MTLQNIRKLTFYESSSLSLHRQIFYCLIFKSCLDVKMWIEAGLLGRCKTQPTRPLPHVLHTHSTGILVNKRNVVSIMYGFL
jgi:hypothetical protein